jgi:hypothetical protein
LPADSRPDTSIAACRLAGSQFPAKATSWPLKVFGLLISIGAAALGAPLLVSPAGSRFGKLRNSRSNASEGT